MAGDLSRRNERESLLPWCAAPGPRRAMAGTGALRDAHHGAGGILRATGILRPGDLYQRSPCGWGPGHNLLRLCRQCDLCCEPLYSQHLSESCPRPGRKGMNRLRNEFAVFLGCSRSMQVLMVSNMIYALVLPVIEIFVAAYVMRNSHAVSKVVTYQLSIYAATPLAFYLNGKMLGRVGAKHLYAAGMLLSGASMMLMMQLSILTPVAVAVSGFSMGLATGIFWANRGFLALIATTDENRNYFYGVENFVATLNAVVVPALIGWLISGTPLYGWLGGVPNRGYRLIAFVVFLLTLLSAGFLERAEFRPSQRTRFVYFHFHRLWWEMLQLAVLKGLAQGYIVTAPAVLIMLLGGQEGTLGTAQAVGGIFSAFTLYTVGRMTAPRHRRTVFAVGLTLFFVGSVVNTILFN